MKAAVYVRVSTEDQARHGYSLQAQVEACRARAEALGAQEVLVFADEGVSGALLSRPGLDGLREAVRGRKVALVVIWDPDRLSRNLSHQLLLTEEIEQARVRLEFVNFEWRQTPEGQLFYALRGAIAQYEKEKIRERTGRGRLQKARQGKLPLAFRPYGYDYDRRQALLVVNEAEARTVRAIFRWFVEEGLGPGAIARRLNGLGVPAKKGGPWHRAVVRQLLANPVYTGVFYANRWDASGCGLNRQRPRGERVSARLRPESEWVPVRVPTLVEPDLWQRAQAQLGRARRLWAGRSRAEYLLSGLLVCGRCGYSMAGVQTTDWGKKRRKYTCRRSSAAGAPVARCGRAVVAEPLEEAVWARVMDWVGNAARLREAAMDVAGGETDGAELAAVEAAIERAEKGRMALLAVLEQGALSPEEAAVSLGRLKARLEELARRREALRSELGNRGTAGTVEGVIADPVRWGVVAEETLGRYRQGAGPGAERRLLVRTVIDRIEVGEGELVLHARWPDAFALTAEDEGTLSNP